MKLMSKLIAKLPAQTAYAHCDVPCGIYDSKPAEIAAATVLKMAEKLAVLPDDCSKATCHDEIRFTMTKEEHAAKCKEELLILWTDYFKPEHLEKYPELHTTFWMAAKQCSKARQSASVEEAQKLVDAVHEIAHLFEEAHK